MILSVLVVVCRGLIFALFEFVVIGVSILHFFVFRGQEEEIFYLFCMCMYVYVYI